MVDIESLEQVVVILGRLDQRQVTPGIFRG